MIGRRIEQRFCHQRSQRIQGGLQCTDYFGHADETTRVGNAGFFA